MRQSDGKSAGTGASDRPPVESKGKASAARTSVWTIDRIEEGSAAIEIDGATFNLPVTLLPAGVSEGDVLSVAITVDAAERARRLEKSRAQIAVKSPTDKPGDITL